MFTAQFIINDELAVDSFRVVTVAAVSSRLADEKPVAFACGNFLGCSISAGGCSRLEFEQFLFKPWRKVRDIVPVQPAVAISGRMQRGRHHYVAALAAHIDSWGQSSGRVANVQAAELKMQMPAAASGFDFKSGRKRAILFFHH